MNPFAKLPRVPTSQEVLDLSFRKANKTRPTISRRIIDRLYRAKILESSKLETASRVMLEQFTSIVKEFPSLDSVDTFYKEIADVTIGLDKLKEAIGGIDGYRQVIKNVSRDFIRRTKSAQTFTELKGLRRACYGRLSSVINKAGGRLELLGDARNKLRKIVSINPYEPTVVVSGAPNVGKSSLVRLISSAKPEVAEYPFTTKNLVIGHLTRGKRRVQVIDTPGLLDRPVSRRNPLELQAIIALRYLAKMIVFLFDPSEVCGYSMETQINISREIRDLFKETPHIIVVNKIDILTEEQLSKVRKSLPDEKTIFEVSALTGKGIDTLVNTVFDALVQDSCVQEGALGSERGDSGK
ncbi:MAG: GTPase [Promethearchaeati archaeon SRVP18_Atabeyarchaeia-1]